MKKMLILLLCLTLSGCATASSQLCTVSINSLSNGESVVAKKCIILSGSKDVNTDDLQFKEYAMYVKRALEDKGYTVVDKDNEADIAVSLAYGISEPQQHSYENPGARMGNALMMAGAGLQGQNPYAAQMPAQIEYVTTYIRSISLSAYDAKLLRESKKAKQLWKTDIVSEGQSNDLRGVFPVMIGAAAKHIGENTGKIINVNLTADNKDVLKIKGIEEVKR